MKYILRIILTPVIAAMAITIRILGWLLQLSAMLFGIAGTVIVLLGILTLISVSVKNGIILLIIAFLVSPLGLPMVAAWLLGQLQYLRYAIQEAVYG